MHSWLHALCTDSHKATNRWLFGWQAAMLVHSDLQLCWVHIHKSCAWFLEIASLPLARLAFDYLNPASRILELFSSLLSVSFTYLQCWVLTVRQQMRVQSAAASESREHFLQFMSSHIGYHAVAAAHLWRCVYLKWVLAQERRDGENKRGKLLGDAQKET